MYDGAYPQRLRSDTEERSFFLHPPLQIRHGFPMNGLSEDEIQRAVSLALTEDVGGGDVTTLATVPASATATAVVAAREPLVVAGLPIAEAAFRQLSSEVHFKRLVPLILPPENPAP